MPLSDLGLDMGYTEAPAMCLAYYFDRLPGGGHIGLPISKDTSTTEIYTRVEPRTNGDFLSAGNPTVQANKELWASAEEEEDATRM